MQVNDLQDSVMIGEVNLFPLFSHYVSVRFSISSSASVEKEKKKERRIHTKGTS